MTGSLGRVCVVDIGGGSTEIALGDQQGPEFTYSARVGTLLGKLALEELERLAYPTLARLRWAQVDHLVFASGTARALQKLLVAQGLVGVDEPLPVAMIDSLAPALESVPLAEFERHGLSPERALTMPTGARLIAAVAQAIGASVIEVADGGLREGVALREWRRRARSAPEAERSRGNPRWFQTAGPLPHLVMGS
jgi:exopolyphosphatase/guanosine-5'-triphosphate,3'-diphosphate pyrophosphatase